MLSKRIISEIRSLHLAKNRKEQGLFIVEGEKTVHELLESPYVVKMLIGPPGYFHLDSVKNESIEILDASEADLSKISMLKTPNKVLAIAEIPSELVFSADNFVGPALVLDGIKDPGNLGTMIRTAEWFGVKAVICSDDTVDCFNPKVVQSAMGSLFRVPVLYKELGPLVQQLKQANKFVFAGATLHGDGFPVQIQNSRNLFIFIGSESHGISHQIAQLLDYKITIAQSPGNKAESLNAAVACGILLSSLPKG